MAKQKKNDHFAIYAVAAVCAVAVIAMIIVLSVPKVERGEFVPPPFEENAISGSPTVDKHLGYSKISSDQMPFCAWVCGNVTLNGNAARLYFTNPAENSVWLKVRLMDEGGDIVGESGILKEGEYVEYVTLTKKLAPGDAITIKIMAYEVDTYHSEGAVILTSAVSE